MLLTMEKDSCCTEGNWLGQIDDCKELQGAGWLCPAIWTSRTTEEMR